MAGLLGAALGPAPEPAAAQAVPPLLPAGPPTLAVTLRRSTEGELAPPAVQGFHLLGDHAFQLALGSGFPVRYHFRLELWRPRRFFDRLERQVEWEAVIRFDPVGGIYELFRSGSAAEQFGTLAAASAALSRPFAVALLPAARAQAGGGSRRFYYVATLEIESLSLSDVEEVERWLRGDLGPAVSRRGDVGDAFWRGARRALVRLSGLPRRRLEARSATFTP